MALARIFHLHVDCRTSGLVPDGSMLGLWASSVSYTAIPLHGREGWICPWWRYAWRSQPRSCLGFGPQWSLIPSSVVKECWIGPKWRYALLSSPHWGSSLCACRSISCFSIHFLMCGSRFHPEGQCILECGEYLPSIPLLVELSCALCFRASVHMTFTACAYVPSAL